MTGLWLALLLAPHVTLVTMGDGEMLYERYGHAALLVEGDGPARVYNFGTTDFSRPDLIQAFLRSHVDFWVSVASWEGTFFAYRRENRTIWLQDLGLTEAEHRGLAARLEWLARPENRIYAYDHFRDNCSTRVRDLIDEATGGQMKRALAARPFPTTYRLLALAGFSGLESLQIGADLLLGRQVDRRINAWEAAFLPRYLRELSAEVRRPSGQMLATPPKVLYERQGPAAFSPTPQRGRLVLATVALLLLLLAALARRSRPLAKTLRLGWALFGGLLGCLLWAFAGYSTLPLLRENASLLLFVPTDFALLFLHDRNLRMYLAARAAAALLVVFLLHPPWALSIFLLAGLTAAGGPTLLDRPLARLAPRRSAATR